VRREDDVRSLVDQTVARFGRLDAAVNSAGTEGKPSRVTEQTAGNAQTSDNPALLRDDPRRRAAKKGTIDSMGRRAWLFRPAPTRAEISIEFLSLS
jgi:NAD(P)-dependent dehydrogenase (short-subunit alcohol dehydrogenase family)